MEVHAARAQTPGWTEWDERWSDRWAAAADRGQAHGQADGSALPAHEHVLALRRPNPAVNRWAAVVVDGDEVLGGAKIGFPQHEDLEVVVVEVLAVDPAHRRRGAGTALAGWVRATAAAAGRTRVVTETERPVHVAESDWPGTVFARRQGLTAGLATARRELRLRLPIPRLEALRAEVERAAAGYALHHWAGVCPDDDHAARLGVLHGRMSTDAPNADGDADEQVWDADRVLTEERRLDALGRRWWTSVAVAPDGAWAGYSRLQWFASVPGLLYQEDTLVLAEHRGRRLGLALKLDVLPVARAAVPAADRVATWNADTNAPMVAVNDAMGFEVVSVGQDWVGPVVA